MCELPSTTGGMSTTASVPTVHWHTGRPMSSDASWAMEMWKAKNASHISTAPTAAARYTRPQHQTEKLQLWLDEKTGAGQYYAPVSSCLFLLSIDPHRLCSGEQGTNYITRPHAREDGMARRFPRWREEQIFASNRRSSNGDRWQECGAGGTS